MGGVAERFGGQVRSPAERVQDVEQVDNGLQLIDPLPVHGYRSLSITGANASRNGPWTV